MPKCFIPRARQLLALSLEASLDALIRSWPAPCRLKSERQAKREMIMSNPESALIVLPPTQSLPAAEKRTVSNVAMMLIPAAMLAALLVCISMQGAPEIDLSNLVAP